ncbi:GNAT family N-acetyltransferase, partial [Turicibacter sanguinis]|nr:GNAT family N-acetyltransferase [Turicibacter sanguinis]
MKKEVNIHSGKKGSFEGLYTFLEVAKIYGMDDSYLRKKVARGKLVVGVDVKKMGRIWIITEQAMVKNFGALKFEEFINNHSEKENINFNKSYSDNKNKKLNPKKNNLKSGRGYYIEEDKKIVSMAKTTAESDLYAMVIGVGTHPKYRNRGYATKCMVRLCKNLIDENKIPCLFYDNEEAG